jgi:Tfp pilus assembly protein PilN
MINLLPPEIKQEQLYTKRNTLLVKYLLVAAIITGLALATLLTGSYLLSKEEAQLSDRLAAKQEDVRVATETANEARELSNQIDTIGLLLDDELKFSQLIPSIAALIPTNANLTSLSLTADTTTPLVLVAGVNSQSTAALMRVNIEASGLFSAADIVSITPGSDATGGRIVTIQALFSEELGL